MPCETTGRHRSRRRRTPIAALVAIGLIALVGVLAVAAAGDHAGHGQVRRNRVARGRRAGRSLLLADPAGTARGVAGAAPALLRRPVLAYPPGWHRIRTDAGTGSAALTGPAGLIEGYVNITPRSGEETLANWSRFRPHHVAAEGARDVRLLAAASNLTFRVRPRLVCDRPVQDDPHPLPGDRLHRARRGATTVVIAARR